MKALVSIQVASADSLPPFPNALMDDNFWYSEAAVLLVLFASSVGKIAIAKFQGIPPSLY